MCDNVSGCEQKCKSQENCLHYDEWDESNHFGRSGNDVWSTIEWDATKTKKIQNSCVMVDWGCNTRTVLDGGKQLKFSYAGGDTVLNCKTWNKNTKTANFGKWTQDGDSAVCVAQDEDPPSCPKPEMVGYWKMIAPVSSGNSFALSVGHQETTSTASTSQVTTAIQEALTIGFKIFNADASETTTASVSRQTAATMTHSATETYGFSNNVKPPSHYDDEQTAYLWQWYFDLNMQKEMDDAPQWCPKQTTATMYTAWTPSADKAPICTPDTVCVDQGLSACHNAKPMFPTQKPIPYEPPKNNPSQTSCWNKYA